MKSPSGENLKPTYPKTIQGVLSAIFNHAVRFYSLKENPVVKAGTIGKGKADEMLFWTQEEYLKFSEQVKDKTISYYGFQILYWCGLRVGELLALTAKDIDLENKVIHVTKSFQRIERKNIITEPKTQKGIRDVVIPDFLVEELKEYLSRLYGFYGIDRIFPVTRAYFNKEIERGAKKANVKKIRVHDLRHSHVSLLISLGFPAVSIANRVGHESATVTFRYAHMFPTADWVFHTKLKEKQKGKNHDLSVVEYKVAKEKEKYSELKEKIAKQEEEVEKLEEKETEMLKKAQLAEKLYDVMTKMGMDDEYLRERYVDVMYENQQLREENSRLQEMLDKALDFMKQFVIDGRSVLDRFKEKVGWVTEKIADKVRGDLRK